MTELEEMMNEVLIQVGYCPECGKQQQVDIESQADGRTLVRVGCPCQGTSAREVSLAPGRTFTLDITPRRKQQATEEKEGDGNENPDQSDL